MMCSVVWPEGYSRGDHDVSWVFGINMAEYAPDGLVGILDELLDLR